MNQPTLEQRLQACQPPTDQSHVMYQTWSELLFLHWQVDPDEIQATLPKGLTVDTFDGKAYIGLVPFYMKGIRPRFLPAVPGISNFLEMNVRTYVYDQNGTPGVWFYSLDANQKLAVKIARKFFHLPYFDATMSAHTKDSNTIYQSHQNGSHTDYTSHFDYTANQSIQPVDPSSLEFFLLERYFLFSQNSKTGALYSGQVHHQTYPLHSVNLKKFNDYPITLAGFETNQKPPEHVIMSKGVQVKVYPLKKI